MLGLAGLTWTLLADAVQFNFANSGTGSVWLAAHSQGWPAAPHLPVDAHIDAILDEIDEMLEENAE
jgi:hypothetical protein